MLIYKIQNKVNDKIYIGYTTKTFEIRFKDHLKAISYIGNALRKYGAYNFNFSIEEDGITDFKILCEREIYWSKFYNSKFPNGYNLTDCGIGFNGYKWTEDRKKEASIRFSGDGNPARQPGVGEKISIANTGKIAPEETRARMRASAPKTKSEDHCQHISEGLMGHDVSDEARQNMRDHVRTEEHSQNISKALTGGTQTAESNIKRSKTQSGIPKSEEWKAKNRKPKKDTANYIIANQEKALKIKRQKSLFGPFGGSLTDNFLPI